MANLINTRHFFLSTPRIFRPSQNVNGYFETSLKTIFIISKIRSNTASCDIRMTTMKQKKIVEEVLPPASFSSTESITSGM